MKLGFNGELTTATFPSNPQLEQDFPNLANSGYEITSDPSDVPNCIGYALYDMRHFWDPDAAALRVRGYYWPPGISLDWELDTITEIFALHGYQVCADSRFENGYEKIALYLTNNEVSHVARQLIDGKWTSKLGPDEDISHNTVEALEGDILLFPLAYGKAVRIMRRPRQ